MNKFIVKLQLKKKILNKKDLVTMMTSFSILEDQYLIKLKKLTIMFSGLKEKFIILKEIIYLQLKIEKELTGKYLKEKMTDRVEKEIELLLTLLQLIFVQVKIKK